MCWGDSDAQAPSWGNSIAAILPLETFCLYPRLASDSCVAEGNLEPLPFGITGVRNHIQFT